MEKAFFGTYRYWLWPYRECASKTSFRYVSHTLYAMNKISLTTALCLFGSASCFAQPPQPTANTAVWGASPPASDDRFSNPKSKLYAGPDGYWNTGEVRANTGGKPYQFKGTFSLISKQTIAVKDLQTLLFDFGIDTQPAPGVYKITGKGNAAQKTVKLSFADVSNSRILEWSSGDGGGTLTVTSANGFLYATTRNVALQPSGLSNKGEWSKPMTLGFEGAMKIE